MELAYIAWDLATLYNDIVWLLNQDTCQLRYKSWILSAPFVKQFQKLYKVKNLVDLVKQMTSSCDLNMEGLASQADTSNQFDTGVRSNQVEDQDENKKSEMLLSVDQDLRMLSTRSMVKLVKKEENTNQLHAGCSIK